VATEAVKVAVVAAFTKVNTLKGLPFNMKKNAESQGFFTAEEK